ncbi:MAG TPA: hypothetical protein VMV84_00370 [Dehalococcoidales bacterium]|nr:hypothetical protein [Dehalococcoidales bacterium]
MAKKDKHRVVESTEAIDIERFNQRLNMLDQRLDNIDSMVTAVAERVMNRPLTLNITCPNCGKNIEIAIIGTERPTG